MSEKDVIKEIFGDNPTIPHSSFQEEDRVDFIYEKRDLEILDYNLGHIANILDCEQDELGIMPLRGAFGLSLSSMYHLYQKNKHSYHPLV